jgi:competence protein ComEA
VKNLVIVACLSLVLVGCMEPQQKSPDELKERSADATAKLKTDTKAIVAGVREGLTRGEPLDLNSASKDDLSKLSGITGPQADQIIAHRPYKSASELVTRRIVTQREYSDIKDKVAVK